jgi:hypothetical protein
MCHKRLKSSTVIFAPSRKYPQRRRTMSTKSKSPGEDGVMKRRVGKVTVSAQAWANAQVVAAFREHFEILSYEWHRGGPERYIATCTSEHFEEVGICEDVPHYCVVLEKREGGTPTVAKVVRLLGDGTDFDVLVAIEAEFSYRTPAG